MFRYIKKILFPIICVACGKDEGKWLCDGCNTELQLHIQRQRYTHISFPIYTLFTPNTVIRKVIHGLKYRYFEESGAFFHTFISVAVKKIVQENEYIFVPVPLHKRKQRKRGFNQVLQLIPPGENILSLCRIRNTQSQMSLKKEERIYNVKDAFHCKYILNPKYIYVILDDVVTTASTMQAVETALLKAGAKNIIGIALSRGL